MGTNFLSEAESMKRVAVMWLSLARINTRDVQFISIQMHFMLTMQAKLSTTPPLKSDEYDLHLISFGLIETVPF